MFSWLENLYVLKKHSFNFSSNFYYNFWYNINICILLHHFWNFWIQKKKKKKETVPIFIFNSASFTFLSSCLYLHLILWIPSEILLTRFDKKLAINFALSIKCNLYDIFFVISSPFLSILVTSSFIGTVNVMYFSMLSSKQVSSFQILLLTLLW